MADSIIYTVTYPAPPVDKGEILRYAGAKENVPEIEALLDACITEMGELSYRVCYREFPVVWGDVIDLGFVKTTSKTVRLALSGCDSIILFAATVGIGIDRLIARYSSVSPAKALMLQAIGAERVESLCNAFCDDMSKKKQLCPRFSAGYGDLPLEVQKNIFDYLDCPRRIGVTLNDSLLMSPSKSVTAVIGVKNADT